MSNKDTKINVSRYYKRKSVRFNVEVLTPMFLGGADGNAELRAAPFKNAIRYWWRIVKGNLSSEKLIEEEIYLFGGIKNNKASKSRVDIVVKGDVKFGENNGKVGLGFKENSEAKGRKVSLAAYLGMGPIGFKGSYEKKPILPGENFKLEISFPERNKTEMMKAFYLMAQFGTIGARSRNGWGSFLLTYDEMQLQKEIPNVLELNEIYTKNKKYPFCFGKDNKGLLCWKISKGKKSWEEVMDDIGSIYMDMRHSFALTGDRDVQKRHILGYPVMHHNASGWDTKDSNKMPTQLRKIVKKNGKGYYGLFLHIPHPINKPWNSQNGSELSVWREIHKFLDDNDDNKEFERFSLLQEVQS